MKNVVFLGTILIVAILMLVISYQIPESNVPQDIITGGFNTPFIDLLEENLSESYPSHPTVEDCYKTSRWRFCLVDAAEISNNVSICSMIDTPDIRYFCIARPSLNGTMCNEIIDTGLRESCTDSVGYKTGEIPDE